MLLIPSFYGLIPIELVYVLAVFSYYKFISTSTLLSGYTKHGLLSSSNAFLRNIIHVMEYCVYV